MASVDVLTLEKFIDGPAKEEVKKRGLEVHQK
jgi:hypothetical protein